ncbi:MAG TPA: serine/threonine-protein kinase, partial [Gemmatimonadaceae bacterium]|nr:serine/threonine-protein kinase [Gemmatimonadaceae bacterium]
PAPETVALVETIRARCAPGGRCSEPRPATAAHPANRANRANRARAEEGKRDLVGRELNGWLIEREIARGGMSTVYLARDAKHDRHVAVKVPRSDLGHAIDAEWLLHEVTVTARLAHPHILPLIDSGASEDMLYLVTPYVPGESLRDRLAREGRLPVQAALAIAGEVAEALDYAHRSGVIHCDIKPENVLLADGHAVVADFGVATALSASTAGTRGAIRGSPPYVSPEQEAGAIVTHASDVYSLGAVLFEMITGSPPRGDVSARDVLALRPDASPNVAALVAECLTRNPARRLPSASALLRRIEGVDPTPEVPAPTRGGRWPRAARIGALAALATIVSLAILAPSRTSRGRGAHETTMRIAREALRRAGPSDSAAAIATVARTLASRGHIVEAFELDPTGNEWAFAEYALGGSLPPDIVRDRYARVLRDARPTPPRTPRERGHRIALTLPLAWWTAHGDTVSLQRAIALAHRFTTHTGASVEDGVWRYVAAAAEADLALARHDTAEALRRFFALPDTLCPWCRYERLQTAQLLAATGRWREAYTFTRRGLGSTVEFDGVSQVAWTLIAARAAEATGLRDEARREFRLVADRWRFADAPLRRVAAEARLAALRLGDR